MVIRDSTSWNILLVSTRPRGRTELDEVARNQPDGNQDARGWSDVPIRGQAPSSCQGLEEAALRGEDSGTAPAWAGLPLSAWVRGRSLHNRQGLTTWIRSQTVPCAFHIRPCHSWGSSHISGPSASAHRDAAPSAVEKRSDRIAFKLFQSLSKPTARVKVFWIRWGGLTFWRSILLL